MADPVTVDIAPAENDDSNQNQGNEAVQNNRSRLSRFVDFVERMIRSPCVIIPSKVRITSIISCHLIPHIKFNLKLYFLIRGPATKRILKSSKKFFWS
jgi:hypothetical protein